jgi:hypothetical protein
MQKLYCYVDETGQDTQGALFLVALVLINLEGESYACTLCESTTFHQLIAQLSLVEGLQKLNFSRGPQAGESSCNSLK